ncbi:MAG TPA: hypothetical protein VLH56_03100, partial [Dissulfurispiraceae bacterium]|nr:hypothetical protein [Dissulfurispiraceae bacterium]
QYSSLNNPDGCTEIDPDGPGADLRANRVAAHFAFNASWTHTIWIPDRPFIQNLLQRSHVKYLKLPRGELPRNAATGGE